MFYRILIVFSFLLQMHSYATAQEGISLLDRKVKCQADTAGIEQILEKLVSENELYFSYNPDILPKEVHSVHEESISLNDLLQKLLPVSKYRYEVVDNQIIITLREISPLKLSGLVVEGRGKEEQPLPYVSVVIGNENIGTMTNSDGKFDLVVPVKFKDALINIRCLGYEPKQFTQEQIKSLGKVELVPVSIKLREIRVKPVDPLDVIRKFRSNIPQNYSNRHELMVTFYRETIKRDDQYIGMWEAIMEMLKMPYSSMASDRVRFLKGRKSNFGKSFTDISLKIQGGPWYISKLDIVRDFDTFLDPSFEHLYNYHFDQPVILDGRTTWVIRFARKGEVDFPCYYGKLYIDADSYALVGADFGLDKKSLKLNGETFIRKEPKGFTTRPEAAEYKVRYRMVEDRWQFYSARTEVLFKVKQNRRNFKTEYRSISDILVTQQYPYPAHNRFGPEGIFRADDIFSDEIGSYDAGFWGNFNVIKPEDDLSKAMTR